ncbi:phosphoenolpyruvate carboxykinase (GTP) [Pseudokineococcus sp. 1T1Z-3]|uniref:phosphoenolpyruvate carboxykinase (GTP) n=1 Tax=Pseudokineococcus sp. 1T1Z-3 TaxID=3132745 RepID=UPI003099BE82
MTLIADTAPSSTSGLVAPPEGATTRDVRAWVERVAALTRPDEVVWCDGSESSRAELVEVGVRAGTFIPLGEAQPDSYLVRSSEDDVARVEDRTYLACPDPADAGPTNNWRDPAEAEAELTGLFEGSMRGRTMYVLPFSMGPVGGAISQLGVQVTDSVYAAVSMHVMTRVGAESLALVEGGQPWVACLHTVGMPLVDADGNEVEDVAWPSNDVKHIAHFTQSREIWSYGSGYGGNALLGKKCFALRIASVMGRDEGWLAEHMLLIRVTSPQGKSYHVAAAFPSACGKTNFAMMQPTLPGWKVETLGDDIVWMRPGPDGRLRAINPEAGFFGVAPGTGYSTNPVAMKMLDAGGTVYTNVALTPDGDVWWEGKTKEKPELLTDWRGRAWTAADGAEGRKAAHPNARFTVAADQCPTLADDWDHPDGVPVDAVLFGGRRASNAPLVTQARDWEHAVFLGATLASEQTAAAEGPVGVLRRDPFAMLPFTGYNAADHWQHWLSLGESLGESRPEVFGVNWFRTDDDGSFIWPGFGENCRVLAWVVARLEGTAGAQDTPAGLLPELGDLVTGDLGMPEGALEKLFAVDPEAWGVEADDTEEFFTKFGDKLPSALTAQLTELRSRLDALKG